MNIRLSNIVKWLKENKFQNQRELSEELKLSLGFVNKGLKDLVKLGYIDENCSLTEFAHQIIEENKPKRAIILAAGYGMRMVPINVQMPKGLIRVNGEPLIERIISQLHEAGVFDIKLVVGFMKESYEYLIDDFGVELIYNKDYSKKNNLHSLSLCKDSISNSYIIPCDVWLRENCFSKSEISSWYMLSSAIDKNSRVKPNKLSYLSDTSENGNKMIGVCYINRADGEEIKKRIGDLSKKSEYDNVFWEAVFDGKLGFKIPALVLDESDAVEINSYEQLLELDSDSDSLKNAAIDVICKELSCKPSDIKKISALKKGMTNRSFKFECKGKKYIMRIPGEGTEKLINRKNEYDVYKRIEGFDVCDSPIYLNPENGYKLCSFIEGVHTCDPENVEELKLCMDKLRHFHELNLKTEHSFDIFEQIDFYESLWNGKASVFKDYEKIKNRVFSLKKYIDAQNKENCLCHIDSVPDNFMFYRDRNGEEQLQLSDWEYAGMQDPHVDIAMFCIYSLYNKEKIDRLIDIYFENECTNENRLKIYCYIAACGLLWSNWCEYKANLGVEFGEYSLKQYRYAKEFSKMLIEEYQII